MDKAVKRLIKAEGLKNNYLPRLILLALIIISSFTSFAQYDSTRNWQNVNSEGSIFKNQKTNGALIVPRDTPRLALRDSGGIAFKGGKFWTFDGQYWVTANYGTVIVGSATIDSVTFTPTTICSWLNGVATCQDFSLLFADATNSEDGSRTIYYNLIGDSIKTKDNPHTDIYLDGGLKQRDTLTNGIVLISGRIDSIWTSADSIWEHRLYMSGYQDSIQLVAGGGSGSGSAVSSGSYTSTVTNVLNIYATSATVTMYWTKIDGIVHISAWGNIEPNATGNTTINLTLPFSTSYTSAAPMGHVTVGENGGSTIANGYAYRVLVNTVNLKYNATLAASGSYFLTLDYPE